MRGKRVQRNSRRCVEAHLSYSSSHDMEQSYTILDQLGMLLRKIYSRQLLIDNVTIFSKLKHDETHFVFQFNQ